MKALLILALTFLMAIGELVAEAKPKTGARREVPAANDPMIGTKWDFLGVNHQRINGFTFLKDGRVRCENTYKNATWKRLDELNILFSYGVDHSVIVFRFTDHEKTNMAGHHYSGHGRYLRLVK